MNTRIKSSIPFIAALTLTAAVAFAHNPNGKADPMNASLEKLSGAKFEQSWLEQMIQHHRSAIDMARLVNDHTERSELRQMAEKIISSQQQEIEKMGDWLKDRFNAP